MSTELDKADFIVWKHYLTRTEITPEVRAAKLEVLAKKLGGKGKLSTQLEINPKTLYRWMNPLYEEKNNKGTSEHTLKQVYDKLSKLTPTEIKDWGRVHMIREEVNRLLRDRK